MNEYGQKRITLEKGLRAYQETGIKPISGTPGRVVDGRVIEGCLTGVVGIYEGLIPIPEEGTGQLFRLVPSHREEMDREYGHNYLSAVQHGFDHAKNGVPYVCHMGWDREGYKHGYEIGDHIRKHGIPKLAVPDYAPIEVEKECVA